MDLKFVPSICPFCGCGCSLYLIVKNGRIIGTMPSDHHPISQRNLCVKGWQAHHFVHHPDRILYPLIREANQFRRVTWSEAIDFTAKKLFEIKKRFGPQAFGVITSARASNEENYLMQKFARAVLSTNSVDHCARL